tara:strand:+ start:976 stop:1281 length:306 start_codon:yes stop_codon:yes gene_type:complete
MKNINKPNKLAFHILADKEHFNEFFTEAKREGIERGLVFRTESDIHKELHTLMSKAKNQGYFPVGIVLDGYNLEFLFKRHPNQKAQHRFDESTDSINNMDM